MSFDSDAEPTREGGKFWKHLKNGALLLGLALFIWALMPPRVEEVPSASSTTNQPAPSSNRKYVIKVAPKQFYMPGGIPMGIGKPLEGLTKVAARFEALYPDTKIEYVAVPTAREWLVTQVSAGLAPDIVDVNVEEVWGDTHKGWYIPLDDFLEAPSASAKPGEPGSVSWFDVLKYPSISQGVAAPDGKIYCIVYDMVETGIFYNKDIFAKVGVAPPRDWTEFLDIQTKLRAAGYIPLLANASSISDWGTDLIFDQYYRSILPGIDLRLDDPKRAAYLESYLDWNEITFLYGKRFFTRDDPRFLEIWRTLKEWRTHMSQDIGDRTVDYEKLFLNQNAAMRWEGSWRVQQLQNDESVDFEWGVFYLPPITPQYSRLATGHDMVVIGGPNTQFVVTNAAISDTGSTATSQRLDRCIKFLQFLTTPESADAIVNEVTCFLPNVKGVEPRPELEAFDEFLERRYASSKWQFTFDMQFNEVMNRMLELYLNDGLTEDEFLEWMERNLKSATEKATARLKSDFPALEKRWNELAPLRATMKDLPNAAR